MSRVTLLAIAVAVVAGCRNLPDIATGECGNGVVDLGEDCDRVSGFPEQEGTACGPPEEDVATDEEKANSCFLICSGDAVCPESWICGADGRCRQPSGRFEEAVGSPWDFPVKDFAVGDVDGDGFADLIGNASTAIDIRYGDIDGTFPDELDVFLSRPAGLLSFTDVSGDGRLDVVAPLDSGVAAFLGTEDRRLEPVLQTPIVRSSRTVAVPLVAVDDALSHSVLFIQDTNMQFGVAGTSSVPLEQGHSVDELVGHVPTRRLIGLRTQFALAFAGASEVFLYTSQGVGAGLVPALVDVDQVTNGQQNLVLPVGTIAAGGRGVSFADVDGNFGPDVVIDVDTGAGRAVYVAYRNSAVELTFNQPTLLQGPAVSEVLAIVDFDGDDVPDVVTPTAALYRKGAMLYVPAGVLPIGDDWSEAVVGDFNHDGLPDFAAAVTGAEGLFVHINVGSGFNRFVVETEEPPLRLRTGDFDGDLVDDIAFVESDRGRAEVKVSFGAALGAPSAAVSMGAFPGAIEVIEPVLVPSSLSLLEQDFIRDLLVVVRDPEEETWSVGVLQGSSNRSMLSLVSSAGGTIVRAVAGDFLGEGRLDVFAFAVDLAGSPVLQYFENLGGGQLSPGAEIELAYDIDPEKTVLTTPDLVNDKLSAPACLALSVGELRAPLGAELIAIDGSTKNNKPCRADVGASMSLEVTAEDVTPTSFLVGTLARGMSGPVLTVRPENVPGGDLRNSNGLELYDADDNGTLDLVTLFEGWNPKEDTGPMVSENVGAGLSVYWNTGDTFSKSPSPLAGPEFGFRAAAPALLDQAPMPPLLVLSRDGVFRSNLSDNKVYQAPELLLPFTGGEKMRVGDVNGDGLEDLVIIRGDQASIFLGVPKAPCGTREGTTDQC